MKAKEVIKRYKAGERNFQGVNLRGQSFKGQNLSGADFTNAKIQGTKFTKAILIKANFTGAECGRTIFSPISWFTIIVFFYVFFNSLLLVAVRNFARLLDYGNPLVNLLSLVLWVLALYIVTFIGLKKLDRILVKETENSGTLVIIVSSVGVGTLIILIILGIIDSFTSYTLQSDVETVILYGTVFGSLIISLIATSAVIIKFVQGILPEKIIFFILLAINSMIIALVANIISIGIIPLILSGIILLTPIYLGWNAAKDMKQESWLRFFAVAIASWDGTSFYNANLTDAIFTEAKLKNADFRKAILTRVCWFKAEMLDQARIENTYLDNLSLLQLLTTGETEYKNFNFQNLQGINLQFANLTNASFIKADLSGTNLQYANLSNAKLIKTELDEANLTGVTLTGACIEDWRINNQTNLKDVICDYVYLKDNNNEKIPYDKNRTFKPGEFAKYVEKALNTVDLIFTDGIDWNAFLTSFKNLQDKYGTDEIGIQAIEKKPSGAFVIRVEVPLNAVKSKFETYFWQKYKPLLEDKNREIRFLSQQTEFYSQELEVIRKDNTRLIGVIETMAEKENSKVNNMNFYAPVSGVAGNVEGNQNVYTLEQKQTLAEAAREIHQLLEQLSKIYPITTNQEKRMVASEVADQIENNPKLRVKVINALKAGAKETLREAINHPLANILMAFIEGWQDAE